MSTTHHPYHPLSMARPAASVALAAASLIALAAPVLAQDASPMATDPSATSCWTAEPGAIGSVDHPTEPSAIVLRMFTGGGFVPEEIRFLENPVFTLYGNNVAIFRPQSSTEALTDPMAPYLCSQLSPEQVDELLTFALEDGGLRNADDLYADPFITDTPSTIFSVDADGLAKAVAVQALGFNPDAPDPESRAGFQALADALSDFEAEVETTQLYEVPFYQGMLSDVWIESPATPISWPWEDLSADDFAADELAIVTLTPAQVAEVAEVPNGGQGYIVVELPDGTLKSLAIKPLLPV